MARRLEMGLRLEAYDIEEIEKIIGPLLEFSDSVELNFGQISVNPGKIDYIKDNIELLKRYFSDKAHILEVKTELPEEIVTGLDNQNYPLNYKLVFRKK